MKEVPGIYDSVQIQEKARISAYFTQCLLKIFSDNLDVLENISFEI